MRTTYPCCSIGCTCKMYVCTVVITFALPVILTNIFPYTLVDLRVSAIEVSALACNDACVCMCFMSLSYLVLHANMYTSSCSRTTTKTIRKQTNNIEGSNEVRKRQG